MDAGGSTVPVRVIRKFGLLDAMILVAAIALWSAALRYFGPATNWGNWVSIWVFSGGGWLRVLQRQTGLLLFILSIAMVLIRLRSPRPKRLRLWRQPGMTGCAAAIMGVLVYAISEALSQLGGRQEWDRFLTGAFWYQWPYAGPAVIGAWLALIFTRRWRAEPGSIDRLGRLIAMCWLIEFLLAEMPGRRWLSILERYLHR
jgi:hypothetical protein